jgi:hypothetical protein
MIVILRCRAACMISSISAGWPKRWTGITALVRGVIRRWKSSGSTGKGTGSFYYLQQFLREQTRTTAW